MDTCGEIETEGRAEFDVWDFFKEGISKDSQTPLPASGVGGWNSIFGQTLQNTSFYLVVKKKWLKRLDSVSAYLKKKENETN